MHEFAKKRGAEAVPDVRPVRKVKSLQSIAATAKDIKSKDIRIPVVLDGDSFRI